jgi:ribonucleotide reductase alpha subunit
MAARSPGYEKNREPFLRVMRKHRAALKDIDRTHVPKGLFAAAKDVWDEAIELGEEHGFRNAQATVLAPTGTIGFMMDCDTTGVEPDIALVKYKKLVGGGLMKIVNQTVPMALEKLGYARSRSRRSSSTSTSTRPSRGRRTSRTRTCRCSTARSSRRAACGRSTTWATSG